MIIQFQTVLSLVALSVVIAGNEPFFSSKTFDDVKWRHGVYKSVKSVVEESAHAILHRRQEVPLHIPLEINVVLVGFGKESNGLNLDSEEFKWFLEQSFPSHRPVCQETGKELAVQHDFSYTVLQADGLVLESVEKQVSEKMALVPTAKEETNSSEYVIDAKDVEPSLDAIYSSLFGAPDSQTPLPATIFILQLRKDKISPSPFTYFYEYSKSTLLTQAWLSHGRYAVIDISSGPCPPERSPKGPIWGLQAPHAEALRACVSASSLSLSGVKEATQPMVEGQLAAWVISAITHFISPDTLFTRSSPPPPRTVLALIELTNRKESSSPLLSDRGRLSHLQAQISSLLPASSSCLLLESSHWLQNHPRIAMAVNTALQTGRTFPEHSGDVLTLDADRLIEEFEHSCDSLLATFITPSAPQDHPNFFQEASPQEEEEGSGVGALDSEPPPAQRRRRGGGASWILPVKKDWQPRDSLAERRLKRRRQLARRAELNARAKGNVTVRHGTRVVPFFILSLGDPTSNATSRKLPRLAMADGSLSALSEGMAVVLNPGQGTSGPNGAELARLVLAGATSLLGAVHADLARSDWLWAVGCHPFGAATSASATSQLIVDAARRNRIYSEVDFSVKAAHEAMELITEFAVKHVLTPLGVNVTVAKQSLPSHWLDRVHSKGSRAARKKILPASVVDRLEKVVEEIEDRLVKISGFLFDQDFASAQQESSYVLTLVNSFQTHVVDQLSKAEEEVRCCVVSQLLPSRSVWPFVYVFILLSGFSVYFVVIFFSRGADR